MIHDGAVRSRDEREADLETDGGRQHEPEVVVGVLADQVDPAGRTHDGIAAGSLGHARFVAAQPLGERLDLERADADDTASSFAGSRRPLPKRGGGLLRQCVVDEGARAGFEPARYLSFVAVRFGG